MKQLLFLILVSCSVLSCSFTRRTALSVGKANSEKSLSLITPSGFTIKVERSKYMMFLYGRISKGNAVQTFDSLLRSDTLYLDTLYNDRWKNWDIYSETDYFIIQELNSGEALISILDHNEDLKRLKRVTRYYRESAIVRGSVRSISFYSGRKMIFRKALVKRDF